MKERVWKTIVCVILCVTVLSLSVSVFADDQEPNPTPTVPPNILPERSNLQLELVAFYAYQMLQAWGIDIQYGEYSEFTEEVKNWLVDMLLDYTIDLGVTIGEWTLPFIFQNDIWGNLLANDRALEDIQDFGGWLKSKFNLANNQTSIIDPVYSINGYYTLYNFDTWYEVSQGVETTDYVSVKLEQNSYYNYIPVGWCIAHISNPSKYYTVAIYSTGQQYIGVNVRVRAYRDDDYNFSSGEFRLNLSAPNNHGLYTAYGDTFQIGSQAWKLPVGDYFEGTNNEFQTFLQNLEVISIGSLKFVTEDIVFPDNDPAYTAGDSITVVDGIPEYSIIEWDGTVTVSNLPAVVSTGTVSNPQLIEVWRPISSVIEYSADAMAAIIGIMYQLPEEVIIPIYAVMGSVIILGVIKLMREH